MVVLNNNMNPLNNKRCIEAFLEAMKKTSGDIRFLGAGYDNLSNFALKSVVTAFVVWEVEIVKGDPVSEYNVTKLLLGTLLKKAEGEIHKPVKSAMCEELDTERKFFDFGIPYTEFRKATTVEAANELFSLESVKDIEVRIVEFAGVLTTLAELKNLRYKLEDSFYQKKRIEMELRCQQYADMPGYDDLKARLEDFAEIGRSLSEQIRWKLQIGGNRASVLKHIGITGILSFFNALEVRDDKEEAGRCFFMGIYHDLPEVWTGDIPSSYKDRNLDEVAESYFYRYGVKTEDVKNIFDTVKSISDPVQKKEYLYNSFYQKVGAVPEDVVKVLNLIEKGITIRDAVEKVEEQTLKQKFYSKLSPKMEEKAKDFMFEEERNKEEYYGMIKGIDYVGAVFEVYMIYMHGSCDRYYLGANDRTLKQIESGKYELGDNIIEIFKEYKQETERLVNSSYNQDKVEELEKKIAQLSAKLAVLTKDE